MYTSIKFKAPMIPPLLNAGGKKDRKGHAARAALHFNHRGNPEVRVNQSLNEKAARFSRDKRLPMARRFNSHSLAIRLGSIKDQWKFSTRLRKGERVPLRPGCNVNFVRCGNSWQCQLPRSHHGRNHHFLFTQTGFSIAIYKRIDDTAITMCTVFFFSFFVISQPAVCNSAGICTNFARTGRPCASPTRLKATSLPSIFAVHFR